MGSRVITDLGLLDRDLTAHHAANGVPTQKHQFGVAYPAVFVLDEAGRIVDKRIRENYRTREGALKLAEAAFAVAIPPAGSSHAATADHVAVDVVADSDEYVRWQETRLHVRFDVEAGWHVYGQPIPAGYTPITVTVDEIPDVTVGPPEALPGRPIHIEGLGDEFHVHDGRFEIQVPITVKVPLGTGRIELRVTVSYQACSDTECLPPASVRAEVSLDEVAPA